MTSRRDALGVGALGVGAAALLASGSAQAHGNTTVGIVSVADQGATGDGATDETVAVQNAINLAIQQGAAVYFPVGTYRITGTLRVDNITVGVNTFSAGGLLLFSDATAHGVHNSAHLKFEPASGPKPLFSIQVGKVRICGLALEGTGETDGNTALEFAKSDPNYDDVDGLVKDCSIESITYGVTIGGRGLRVESNTFFDVQTCVQVHNWPGGEYQNDPYQEPPWGVRAYFISFNRVHARGTLLHNAGDHPLWGLVLTNNLFDVGGVIFRGACRDSSISNNVVSHANEIPIFLETAASSGWISNVVISGNVIAGAADQGGHTGRRPSNAIWVGCHSYDMIIANNAIAECNADGILFGGFDHKNIVITGNSIRGVVGDGKAWRGAVRFGTGSTLGWLAITGNGIRIHGNATHAVQAPNGSIHDSQIIGNASNRPVVDPGSVGSGTTTQ